MSSERVKLGRILSPFGIHGWVNFYPYTDPDFDWDAVETVYLETPDGRTFSTAVLEWAPHKPLRILFEHLTDRTTAEAFGKTDVWIDKDALPPPDDADFYEYELVGVPVKLTDGTILGKLGYIFDAGGAQVLAIEGKSGKEILIPNTAENVQSLSREAIIVHPLDGLLDLNR